MTNPIQHSLAKIIGDAIFGHVHPDETPDTWGQSMSAAQNVLAEIVVTAAKAQTPSPAPLSVADYATRLFDLHGFMLLETYRGKHAVTITFPDLKEAQQFHNALVELSQHRVTLEGTNADS